MTKRTRKLLAEMMARRNIYARASMERLNHPAVVMARKLAPCTCSNVWIGLIAGGVSSAGGTHEFTCDKRNAERVVLRKLR